MTTSEIVSNRLSNQQIADTKFSRPQEIVHWMAAMQAQEFALAKWAVGLRLPGINNIDVETAFDNREILRTHLLRPTWHFVTPADIRWMLMLTAPFVNQANAFMYRKLELNIPLFKRSNNVLEKTLQGGKHLTRATLQSVLERAKINATGLRLGYIVMRAELDGIICSGPRDGKQFTYALLEERVPPSKTYNHEEALAELTRRYFTSRGPATLQDFAVWSGFTMKEAKAGVALLNSQFAHEVIDGKEYVFFPAKMKNLNKLQKTFLLPDYDEYGMSYKDRSAMFPSNGININIQNGLSNHIIIIDGIAGGTWHQIIKNNSLAIETSFFTSLTQEKQKAVADAVEKYTSFMNNELMKK